MKPAFRIFVTAILLIAVLFVGYADAQYYRSNGCYNGYCQPTYSYKQPTYSYSAPSYSSVTYPYYGGWDWKLWDTDPTYYIRYRWQHLSHCDKVLENDGWLYQKGYSGEWLRHCKISEYAAKPVVYPLGQTQVGYSEPTYRLVQQYPYLMKPGVLIAKQPAAPPDPRDFLVPYENNGNVIVESAAKSQSSAMELALQVAKGEQQKELEQLRARTQLSRDSLAAINDERFMSEIKELFALRQKSATIQRADDDATTIAVKNPDLAKVVETKCFNCHGGAQGVAKNIDFRKELTPEQWRLCYRQVATGAMPQKGQPLSGEELDLFELEMLSAYGK